MIAQRVVWTDRATVMVEAFDIPDLAAGQLLVQTHYTLISPGTERAFLLGLENTSQRYPQYPGYNNVGEVLAVGDGVQGFAVGDIVATAARHASHVIVAAADALHVPAGLWEEHAVFFNMGAIALQGVRKAKIELGESVVVLGQGMIGNIAMQLAKLSGALPVIGIDTSEHRLALARACGADATRNPQTSPLDNLTSAVVIEATGFPEPVKTAFQVAGWHGRVVLLASTRGETEKVNFYSDVHRKGLTVYGAHNSVRPAHDSTAGFWTARDDGETVLRLLTAGRLVVDNLISHRLPAVQAANAYRQLAEWSETLMGVVLEWR
ncbi:MAG: zinc-binding alcohol dehydrogenase [Candidatus Latescibacteria bacterium]|nr:zinc-binding alcohol dehydrogenase [Candidatus Latescibacterota bacterium]